MNERQEVSNAEIESLSPRELRERMRDPHHLPSRAEAERAFNSNDSFAEVNGSSGFAQEVGSASAAWTDQFRQNHSFEFLSKEFIERLGNYLSGRIGEFGKNKEGPVIVLEIGAGNGRLAHFIEAELAKQGVTNAKVVAVDSGEANIPPLFPVEQMTHLEAIEKYHPDIVISSWMPLQVDLTKDIRDAGVPEYIMIGDSDATGLPGASWGEYPDKEEGDEAQQWSPPEGWVPPYAKDGYEAEILEDVSDTQLHWKSDPVDWNNPYVASSMTKVFRKNS